MPVPGSAPPGTEGTFCIPRPQADLSVTAHLAVPLNYHRLHDLALGWLLLSQKTGELRTGDHSQQAFWVKLPYIEGLVSLVGWMQAVLFPLASAAENGPSLFHLQV